jgi:hypothetical protein
MLTSTRGGNRRGGSLGCFLGRPIRVSALHFGHALESTRASGSDACGPWQGLRSRGGIRVLCSCGGNYRKVYYSNQSKPSILDCTIEIHLNVVHCSTVYKILFIVLYQIHSVALVRSELSNLI